MNNNTKSYNGIDIGKFICAFLIIAIHTNPFISIDERLNHVVVNYIARIAVPFFFISSGFFLFRKMDLDGFYADKNRIFNKKIPLQYAIRIYKLYWIWTAIYFVISAISILKNPHGILYGIALYVRNVILVGSELHLWYLIGTTVAVLLITFLVSKRMKLKYICLLSGILYCTGLFAQSYFGLIKPLENIPIVWKMLHLTQKIISTTRNGLFEGFFFVSIGMLLTLEPVKRKVDRITLTNSVVLFVVSMAAFYFEFHFLSAMHWTLQYDMWVFLVPAAIFFFLVMLKMDLPSNGMYRSMRESSILIFYIHIFVREVIGYIVDGINLIPGVSAVMHSMLLYVLVAVCSFVIAEVIKRLSRKERFQYLKKIY